MKNKFFLIILIIVAIISSIGCPRFVFAQKIFTGENLSRALVAVPKNGNQIFLSWRLFKTDSQDIAFNIYRKEGSGTYQKITTVSNSTNFIDTETAANKMYFYYITEVSGGTEGAPSKEVSVASRSLGWDYVSIELKNMESGYRPLMIVPGDLDGDGNFDFVFKSCLRGINCDDNGDQHTYHLEAHSSTGNFLWKTDLGLNDAINGQPWSNAFTVWDLDGDKKAEVIARRKFNDGKTYLTIFNGLTGEVRDKIEWPKFNGRAQNDRHMLVIAYLDGKNPSLVVQTGGYFLDNIDGVGLEAFSFFGNKLKPIWQISNFGSKGGSHDMRVIDYDDDGNDEILVGDNLVGEGGSVVWHQSFGHYDHFDQVIPGNFQSNNPGYEVYFGLEEYPNIPGQGGGAFLVDMLTGKVLWKHIENMKHTHTNNWAADVVAKYPGWEAFSTDYSAFLFSSTGEVISNSDKFYSRPPIQWDDSNQKSLISWHSIVRVDDNLNFVTTKNFTGDNYIDGGFSFDMFGDFREEILNYRDFPVSVFRIYINTELSQKKYPTPLQDRYYRESLSQKGMGYQNPIQLLDPGCYFGYNKTSCTFSYNSGYFKSDFNSDGKVDVQDFGILLSRWNKTTGLTFRKKNLDLASNNKIDTADLGALLGCWGTPDSELCMEK